VKDLLARVTRTFAERFGGEPALVARAPGRVNLIGEHTDYNDGFVLPLAIGRQSLIAARPRKDRQVTVIAADFANAEYRFELDEAAAPSADQPWSNYVRGMVAAMQAAGYALTGADIVLAGNIPQGSGLSSSASVAVAVGIAFDAMAGLHLDATRVARLAQACECDFVGTRCGIMDQLVSARGKAGHALLIDCRSLDCAPIPLPDQMAIVIVHSGITRGLVEGAYNERRAQCEAAARHLGVAALRDADLPQLEAHAATLDAVTFRRARHVITENARTLAAADALRADDRAALGRLMAQSHASMRDDFAITLPPIDALVAELQALIGPEGGARMTGGGFGGAVVALMPRYRAVNIAERLTYCTPDGARPDILIESAAPGAGLL
jgi:galactokinase